MHTLFCHPLPWCSALTSRTFRWKLIESGPLASPPEPASCRPRKKEEATGQMLMLWCITLMEDLSPSRGRGRQIVSADRYLKMVFQKQ